MAVVGIATIWALHTRSSMQSMEVAQGTVIGFGPSGDRYQGPTVRFEVDGRHYQFTDSVHSKRPPFKVGETVEVRYDPARPEQARVNAFGQLYLMQLVIGLIGAALLFLGFRAWFLPPQAAEGPTLPQAKQL